jgi:hypothetical protein
MPFTEGIFVLADYLSLWAKDEYFYYFGTVKLQPACNVALELVRSRE